MSLGKRIFNISNMYPSIGHSTYGIFVRKFEEAIEAENFIISSRSVISGKGLTKLTKTLKYLRFYFSILFNVLKNDYDLIYIHYISNSSPVLYFLYRFIRKPIVINFHGGDLLLVNGLEKYTRLLTRSLIEKADLLIVPSAYFKKEVLDRFNVEKSKIHIYPSGGIDLQLFKPLDADLLKKKFELTGFFVIGFVARIDKGKRWDLFLNAIHFLRTEQPDIKCKAVIVGNGLEIDSFRSHVAALKLEDYILFLGEKDHKYLPELYNLMDVFVFATDNESLGLVGLEAMACGVPVIAPAVGGIRSYLRDQINGFYLDSLNEHQLVEKLTKFYRMGDEQKRLMKHQAFLTPKEFEHVKVGKELASKLNSLIINKFV